jgi:hypothetical protein
MTAPPPESLLVRYVKAHVRKGEQAKERAAQNHKKSEGHFIAAGRYLAMLKTSYAPSWKHWDVLLQVKVGLSTGRASELMQLADGRKSSQEIRDATAQRLKALRARGSSLQGQRNEEEDIPDEMFDEGRPASNLATALSGARSARGPLASDGKADPTRLVDNLAQSTPTVRRGAVWAVTAGSRQSQFEQVRDAVADLYQQQARTGR